MFNKLRQIIGLTLFVSALAGCAGTKGTLPPEVRDVEEGADAVLKRIRANPEGFLHESLAEAAKLKHYTARFQRQERLGLLAELKPTENILAECREHPFSVRFTWQDADSEYAQCVYVQGQNDNKVVLLPRKGLLGLPPAPQAFAPSLSVLFGKSRNPITDFGPRRMLERTLDRIAKARKKGEVQMRVLTTTEIGPAKEPCYHIEIRFPQGDEFPCKLQDLYIHMQTRIPTATWLWLPGKPERAEETLDGMYIYASIDPGATVNDSSFVIDPKLREGKPGGVTATGGGQNAQAAEAPSSSND